MINTLLGMVIDTDTMRPALAGVTGGLSGPAIRPVAVRCVWQVHAAMPDVPILGMGGIRTGADALEFVLAGASAVSVGTASSTTRPRRCGSCAELQRAARARGFDRLADAVGYAHRARHEPDLLASPAAQAHAPHEAELPPTDADDLLEAGPERMSARRTTARRSRSRSTPPTSRPRVALGRARPGRTSRR